MSIPDSSTKLSSMEVLGTVLVRGDAYFSGTIQVTNLTVSNDFIVSGSLDVEELILKGSNLSETITLQPPNLTLGSYGLELPIDGGILGQYLTTDGISPNAELSWSTGAGTGDLEGPISSSDNEIARFNGLTGKIIQDNSGVIILDDNSNIVGANNISAIDVTVNSGVLNFESTDGSNSITKFQTPAILTSGSFSLTLPSDTGTANQMLTTDGGSPSDAVLSWTSSSSFQDLGNDKEVFFNDIGLFGANSNLTFDKSTGNLTATKIALKDSTGDVITLSSPSILESYSLILPSDTGSAGHALVTDGNNPANLSWSSQILGNLVGPSSSTDDAISRFDGTSGKLIKNSGIIVDGSSNFTGIESIAVNNITVKVSAVIGSTVSNTVALKSPALTSGSYTLTLPIDDYGNIETQLLSYDTTDSVLIWRTYSKPVGSNGYVQYNDDGYFNGSLDITFDNVTDILEIAGKTVNMESGTETTIGDRAITHVTISGKDIDIGDAANLINIGINAVTDFGNVKMLEESALRLVNPASITDSINISSPTTLSSSYGIMLPSGQGVNLTTILNDGAGITTWGTFENIGGSNTQIQFNDDGVMNGTSNLTYNNVSNDFNVGCQTFFTGLTTGVSGNAVGITQVGELVDTVSMRQYKKDEVLVQDEPGYEVNKILELEPKFFDWKKKPDVRELGFIVEEVVNINNDAYVIKDLDNNPKNLKDRSLLAGLVALIQEQHRDIVELKSKLIF
jgi:hypothetical protein